MDKNHIPSKVSDEITYSFPNFNGTTVEVWMDKLFQTTLYNGHIYLPMRGLMLAKEAIGDKHTHHPIVH